MSKYKKMFWEVWRNVTSATTNWSLGGGSGNSGGAKKGIKSFIIFLV